MRRRLCSSPRNHQAIIQGIMPYDPYLDSNDSLSRKGGLLMARHFDQQAFQRAAAILKIAAHYSRDELNAALAAARWAFLYSLEQAGADIDKGRALFEALDVAQESASLRIPDGVIGSALSRAKQPVRSQHGQCIPNSGSRLGGEVIDDQGGEAITRPQAAIPATSSSRSHSSTPTAMR
jgi:hypothetical protein